MKTYFVKLFPNFAAQKDFFLWNMMKNFTHLTNIVGLPSYRGGGIATIAGCYLRFNNREKKKCSIREAGLYSDSPSTCLQCGVSYKLTAL